MGDEIVLTARFDDAFLYARRLHQSQLRKGTAIPYISHLMAVSALVVEHGGDESQAIAGLLHDAAEDQGGLETLAEIRAMFGDAVADIVADCTDAWTEPKPPWHARKEAYLEALPRKPQASLLVSLADKTHNAEAILFDYRVLGVALWDRFNGGAEGTRWYYGALAGCFANIMPGRLSDRLSRAVQAFSS
jgi:(p)ppGpp synthase/HD superfamily hydrolase